MGDDHSDRLGPEGSEQAKVYKGAGNGGEIDHKKLGDNLCNLERTPTQLPLTDDEGQNATLAWDSKSNYFIIVRRTAYAGSNLLPKVPLLSRYHAGLLPSSLRNLLTNYSSSTMCMINVTLCDSESSFGEESNSSVQCIGEKMETHGLIKRLFNEIVCLRMCSGFFSGA